MCKLYIFAGIGQRPRFKCQKEGARTHMHKHTHTHTRIHAAGCERRRGKSALALSLINSHAQRVINSDDRGADLLRRLLCAVNQVRCDEARQWLSNRPSLEHFTPGPGARWRSPFCVVYSRSCLFSLACSGMLPWYGLTQGNDVGMSCVAALGGRKRDQARTQHPRSAACSRRQVGVPR